MPFFDEKSKLFEIFFSNGFFFLSFLAYFSELFGFLRFFFWTFLQILCSFFLLFLNIWLLIFFLRRWVFLVLVVWGETHLFLHFRHLVVAIFMGLNLVNLIFSFKNWGKKPCLFNAFNHLKELITQTFSWHVCIQPS